MMKAGLILKGDRISPVFPKITKSRLQSNNEFLLCTSINTFQKVVDNLHFSRACI